MKKINSNTKRVLLLVISFIACIALSLGISFAAFGGLTGDDDVFKIKAGVNVGSAITSTVGSGKIVPGDEVNLSATANITPANTDTEVVPTLIRAKLTFGGDLYIQPSISTQVTTFTDAVSQRSGYWVYYPDGYHYLCTTTANANVANTQLLKFVTPTNGVDITLAATVEIPLELTAAASGKYFNMTVRFEVVQAEIYTSPTDKLTDSQLTIGNEKVREVFGEFGSIIVIDETVLVENELYKLVLNNLDNKKYLYFGQYPQTIKSSDVTITNAAVDEKGYYTGSDGAKYALLTATPETTYDHNKASDGTLMEKNTEYYFKVEPLKWRVLNEDEDGTALIVCDNALQALAYQKYVKSITIDESEVYYINSSSASEGSYASTAPENTFANNYKYSNLRWFLNNEFLTKSFSDAQRNVIITTNVDNSALSTGNETNIYACENTFDKVFSLSYQELQNPEYGFESNGSIQDTDRAWKNTDYAKATGALTSTEASMGHSDEYTVDYEGSADTVLTRSPLLTASERMLLMMLGRGFSLGVNSYHSAVVPALNINLGDNTELVIKETEEYKLVQNFTDGKQYVYIGEYPQTIKASDVTITDAAVDEKGYYTGSDGAKYALQSVSLTTSQINQNMNIASDGTAMASGTQYYFKVEPLKWRVLNLNADGSVMLMANTILENLAYQPNTINDANNSSLKYVDSANASEGSYASSAPENTYANNYKYSNLRWFLNNEFLNNSFTDAQRNVIITTNVDNSASSTDSSSNPYACDNTFDKVFSLSHAELINDNYGFDTSYSNRDFNRAVKTSDYAKASGAYTCTEANVGTGDEYVPYISTGLYWTRSPMNSTSSNFSRAVNKGQVLNSNVSYLGAGNGVVPAINLNLNDGKELVLKQTDTYKLVHDNTTGLQYVYFGEFPQTIKASDVTITSDTADENGYYTGSDGERYVKHTKEINTFNDEQTYLYHGMHAASNGTALITGTDYYFKVEPLKWKVLNMRADGSALIWSDIALQSLSYQPNTIINSSLEYVDSANAPEGSYAASAPANTYASNYMYSNLRYFLNETFFNKYLSEAERSIVLTTNVDNSVESTKYYPADEGTDAEYICENTQDKVFALSIAELVDNVSLGFLKYNTIQLKRAPYMSDFAVATGLSWVTQSYADSSSFGLQPIVGTVEQIWTRTPMRDDASNISHNGRIMGVGYSAVGKDAAVMPALNINLND